MDNSSETTTEFDEKIRKEEDYVITLGIPKASSLLDKKRNTIIFLIGLSCCIISVSFIEAGLGPSIGRITYEFNDSKNLSWYSTAFLLTTAVFQLLAVRISDCLGRRRVFLYAIILMFLSSLLGGFSQESILFLVCRVLQGCASGICQSLVLAVLIDLFPLEKRLKYQPIINTSYGLTNIIAPVLAGIYIDHLTWRCTFWTTTLITIPSFIIIYFLLDIPLQPEQQLSKDNLKLLARRIDPIGCLLASAGVILFLTSLNVASTSLSAWSSPLVLSMLIGSIVVGGCFIVFEKWLTPWPIFPSEMVIGNRNLVLSYLLVFISGWHYIIFDLFILIEYQTTYLQSSTNAGLALIPSVVSYIATGLAANKLLRWLGDLKPIAILSNIFSGIGALMLIVVQQDNSHLVIRMTCLVVYAMGSGFAGQTVGLATQLILEEQPETAKFAASSMALARCLIGFSGAVCTAVSLALLLTELTWRIQQTPPEIYAILRDSGVLENYTRITSIRSETALNVIRSIYLDSFKTVFYLFLAWSIIGTILSLIITLPKMKKS